MVLRVVYCQTSGLLLLFLIFRRKITSVSLMAVLILIVANIEKSQSISGTLQWMKDSKLQTHFYFNKMIQLNEQFMIILN